jgi:flavorubredoxin
MLKERGVEKINVYDVTRTHPSYVVGDAFRFTNIVLASPTYNNHLHPTMSAVLEDM